MTAVRSGAVAVIHEAELTPGKYDLLARWLPTRPWAGGATDLERIGAYRFDDPAGEVGMETHLVGAGGRILQVPLTYRARTLFGADEHLIGTMEHSVLGTRYVYDGCGDHVYLTALASTVLTGGEQAPVLVQQASGLETPRDPDVLVRGATSSEVDVPRFGRLTLVEEETSTTVRAGAVDVIVARVLPDGVDAANRPALTGTWPGRDRPAVLAVLAETA